MVAYGIFAPNFGRWWGLMNVILSFYDDRLSGGDTQTLPAVVKKLTFSIHSVWGCKNISFTPTHLVKLSLLNFYILQKTDTKLTDIGYINIVKIVLFTKASISLRRFGSEIRWQLVIPVIDIFKKETSNFIVPESD